MERPLLGSHWPWRAAWGAVAGPGPRPLRLPETHVRLPFGRIPPWIWGLPPRGADLRGLGRSMRWPRPDDRASLCARRTHPHPPRERWRPCGPLRDGGAGPRLEGVNGRSHPAPPVLALLLALTGCDLIDGSPSNGGPKPSDPTTDLARVAVQEHNQIRNAATPTPSPALPVVQWSSQVE